VLGTAAAETITLPKSETGIGFTVALRGGNDEISLSEGSIDVVIFLLILLITDLIPSLTLKQEQQRMGLMYL